MQRNKTISYDEDDLYDDDYANEDEPIEYSTEDLDNFASLTPVVRAALEEGGLKASDREIEEGLWESYWDVAEAVGYVRGLIRGREGKGKHDGTENGSGKKQKVGSRFDEAAQRSQAVGGGTGGGGELICFLFASGGENERWREDFGNCMV